MTRAAQRFDGQAALVTGGARGIGAATAALLAERGADVAVLDREAPQRFDDDAPPLFVEADVRDAASLEAAIATVCDRFGRLDILVNNAGAELTAKAEDMALEDWERVLAVNVTGTMLASRTALPFMRAAGGGAIVNVSSISGLLGWPASTAYCTAKGAVIQLTRQMAVDHGQEGIRVNAVCPGTTLTPMIERLFADMPDPETARAQITELHPIGRFAQPREIAGAVAFLASRAASFITGAILPVDGGYTAK